MGGICCINQSLAPLSTCITKPLTWHLRSFASWDQDEGEVRIYARFFGVSKYNSNNGIDLMKTRLQRNIVWRTMVGPSLPLYDLVMIRLITFQDFSLQFRILKKQKLLLKDPLFSKAVHFCVGCETATVFYFTLSSLAKILDTVPSLIQDILPCRGKLHHKLFQRGHFKTITSHVTATEHPSWCFFPAVSFLVH